MDGNRFDALNRLVTLPAGKDLKAKVGLL